MRIFLLLLVWLGAVAAVSAQETREVFVQADSSVTSRVSGREVTELFGVDLQDGDTYLRADRALDYGDGTFDFFRSVRIVEEGDTLTANEVRYNRHTRFGTAVGDVRLGDGEVVVTAPEGDFDMNANRADFRNGVRMVDSLSVLTSTSGSYWTDESRAEFHGDVRLDSEDTDVLADSLTYFRNGQRSLATGHVIIVRSKDNIETFILGDHAVNDDSLKTGRADGNVLVAQIRSDSTVASPDTLLIVAERVFSDQTDRGDRMSAAGSVLIWKENFSAIADSLIREVDTGADRTESRMYRNPIIWVDESQVVGDTIRVAGLGSGVDSLVVSGNAFVAQRDTVLEKLQQLKGRGLVGLFESDSLRTMQVSPNAEAVFYNRTDSDELGGALEVTADRIVFFLGDSRVDSLKVYQDVEGQYFPTGLIPENLGLSGLDWRPSARPKPEPMLLRLRHAVTRVRPKPTGEPN
jgi:lipopolysaccharide export system protein LptA